MTDSAVTKTQTQITVEEVTETRHECYVCEMLYDPDDVIRVGIDRNVSDGASVLSQSEAPRAERTICDHCAAGLFDYESDADSVFAESQTHAGVSDFSVATVYGTFLVVWSVFFAALMLIAEWSGVSPGLLPAVGVACVFGMILRGWLS